MRWLVVPLLFVCLPATLCFPAATIAGADFVLTGRILDGGGNPVERGEVFVYDTPATRRPADFISAPTDKRGEYRLVVPAGKFWVVARVRSGEKFGPLMPGGKHSGEAQAIEGGEGEEIALDFTVADVREMARRQRKAGEDHRRVDGRILGRDGSPLGGAYAFARREKQGKDLPDFVSPWSDGEGHYTLLLPPGSYCLGGAKAYPPEGEAPCSALMVDSTQIDIVRDIRLNYSVGGKEEGNQGSRDTDDP
jgi:hypothetical protein